MRMKTTITFHGMQVAAPPRRALTAARRFHASASSRASILFALNALSNSRETQHFNKISRLERVEHSPALKLIKTGEVDAVARRESTAPALSAPTASSNAHRRASPPWDHRALQVGRTILADNARALHRASRALDRAQAQVQLKERQMEADRMAWAGERRKLQRDIQAAGIWILVSVSVATGLAAWRYWPGAAEPKMKSRLVADEARLESGVTAAVHAPASVSDFVPAVPVEIQQPVPSLLISSDELSSPVRIQMQRSHDWWRSLLWKRTG